MLTVLNYKSLARFKQDVIGMLDKNSQNDTSNASKRIICLYRKHIGPRIKQKVCTENTFMQSLWFVVQLKNIFLLGHQRLSPKKTRVLVIALPGRKHSLSPLLSFLAAFLCRVGHVSTQQVDTEAHQPFCLLS